MRYTSHSNGSGRSVAWLARLLGVQEVESSNLSAPTIVIALSLRFSDCRLFYQPTSFIAEAILPGERRRRQNHIFDQTICRC